MEYGDSADLNYFLSLIDKEGLKRILLKVRYIERFATT